jgi:hypothetical protein
MRCSGIIHPILFNEDSSLLNDLTNFSIASSVVNRTIFCLGTMHLHPNVDPRTFLRDVRIKEGSPPLPVLVLMLMTHLALPPGSVMIVLHVRRVKLPPMRSLLLLGHRFPSS